MMMLLSQKVVLAALMALEVDLILLVVAASCTVLVIECLHVMEAIR